MLRDQLGEAADTLDAALLAAAADSEAAGLPPHAVSEALTLAEGIARPARTGGGPPAAAVPGRAAR